MLAHLSIGTTADRIDLLSPGGFMLDDWVVGGTEADTIFQESQLADFRQMAAYRDVTIIDTFMLKLKSGSQDQAARALQRMRTMLRLMLDYWTTTWQTSVVYLQTQASCETNMRYAVVYDGRLVGESSPLGQPFLQAGGTAVMDALSLIIERGPWLENAPGTGTLVETGVSQTYDGRTFGNVDSTGTLDPTSNAGEVFVSNKHNIAQLTDAWYWDTSAGAWVGANLLDAALPTAFLPPAPLQAGDFVLFGIDTSVADSGPFCSLVFDIGTAIGVGGGITIQWRLPLVGDGAAPAGWTAITVQDNTNAAGAGTGDAFDTTGIHSVHWETNQAAANWTTVNPDPGGAALGVTGWWICAYVSAAAGAPTPPTQANRDVYTVTWPYVDIDESQVPGGDMPALLRLSVDTKSARNAIPDTTPLYSQRVIAGLRAYNRGEDVFTSYLNISDEQNNASVTIGLGGGMGAWADNVIAATGRTSLYTAAAVDAMATRVYITLTPDWYGRFHAFVRGKQQSGVAGCVGVRLGYAPTDSGYPSELFTNTRYFLNTNGDQILDMGEIAIGPEAPMYPLEVGHLTILLQAECTDVGGATAYFYELILIPIDEWAVDSEDILKNQGSTGYTNDYFSHYEMDGIRNQRNLLSFLIANASGNVARYWRPITNGLPILQTRKDQRLWFLCTRNNPYSDADNQLSDSEICSTIQLWRQQRYTTLRGDQ